MKQNKKIKQNKGCTISKPTFEIDGYCAFNFGEKPDIDNISFEGNLKSITKERES